MHNGKPVYTPVHRQALISCVQVLQHLYEHFDEANQLPALMDRYALQGQSHPLPSTRTPTRPSNTPTPSDKSLFPQCHELVTLPYLVVLDGRIHFFFRSQIFFCPPPPK